jgi:hypothetical protein
MRKANRRHPRDPAAAMAAHEVLVAEYAQAHNERFRVVAYDGEVPVIAEELEARTLKRLSPKARRIATALLLSTPDVRAEALGAFEASGALRSVLEPVPAAAAESAPPQAPPPPPPSRQPAPASSRPSHTPPGRSTRR